jgi:hypothetical protein
VGPRGLELAARSSAGQPEAGRERRAVPSRPTTEWPQQTECDDNGNDYDHDVDWHCCAPAIFRSMVIECVRSALISIKRLLSRVSRDTSPSPLRRFGAGQQSLGTKRRGDSMQPRSAILSTKCMRQGIGCRRGEPTYEQRLASGFGFVDPGELALNGAEREKSQRGQSDRICESL